MSESIKCSAAFCSAMKSDSNQGSHILGGQWICNRHALDCFLLGGIKTPTDTKKECHVHTDYAQPGAYWIETDLGTRKFFVDGDRIIGMVNPGPMPPSSETVDPLFAAAEPVWREYLKRKNKLVDTPAATKHDAAKPRFSLLPHGPLVEVIKVYEFGAGKYGNYNWQYGLPYTRWYDAVMRHLFAWFMGEQRDPESNLHHLAHATFGLLALMWQEENNKGEDDRP